MWDKFLQENSSDQGGIRTRDLSISKPASYHSTTAPIMSLSEKFKSSLILCRKIAYSEDYLKLSTTTTFILAIKLQISF
ncbi:hypothetical protein DPMN_147817 [Dreissena polymorpha]|uniref:Uncharacterized protein n=1 Tax=Dreissena polymorpha TaxID=45954 RepID=A0A9D4IZN0_DREPO|nr:hypothetical protein DPMN_147817 [Dreissena polymorpha]